MYDFTVKTLTTERCTPGVDMITSSVLCQAAATALGLTWVGRAGTQHQHFQDGCSVHFQDGKQHEVWLSSYGSTDAECDYFALNASPWVAACPAARDGGGPCSACGHVAVCATVTQTVPTAALSSSENSAKCVMPSTISASGNYQPTTCADVPVEALDTSATRLGNGCCCSAHAMCDGGACDIYAGQTVGQCVGR